MKELYIKKNLNKSKLLYIVRLHIVGSDRVRYFVYNNVMGVVLDNLDGINVGLVKYDIEDLYLDFNKGVVLDCRGSVITGGSTGCIFLKFLGVCLNSGVKYNISDTSCYKDVKGDKGKYVLYQASNGVNYVFNSKCINYFKNKSTEIHLGGELNMCTLVEENKVVGFILGVTNLGSSFKNGAIKLSGGAVKDSLTKGDIKALANVL